MTISSDDAEGRRGRYEPPAPAPPDADHARNFNKAMRHLLEDWPTDARGDFRIQFEVTINPGSVKEYRIIPLST